MSDNHSGDDVVSHDQDVLHGMIHQELLQGGNDPVLDLLKGLSSCVWLGSWIGIECRPECGVLASHFIPT